ncbi:hypothetical protein WICPIJ_008629 [Wickerhamomyces pijperi]|uniref:SWR1-complex protein 4 n=1 Tax=Wickerhamomyces pijperi TaxID=599730 RepID=A0A9P8PY47_WICPI|nr:hypothetical protein WICPIJ_008629 [Wickerhamomyces pijperi]
MSSSDILDVLNIQSGSKSDEPSAKRQKLNSVSGSSTTTTTTSTTTTTGATDSSDFKGTGISRELYQLLGQNTPPILLKQQSKFKDKALDKVTPWHWAKFQNKSRKDGLNLRHWNKGSDALNTAAYKFEKYNTKGYDVPSFTKEDYEEFLAENDKEEEETGETEETEAAWGYEETQYLFHLVQVYDLNWIEEETGETEAAWGYEETQYLFHLVQVYDLNWIVLYDRYKYQGRRLEDLKERFYTVCQRILIHRNEKSSTNANSNLITNLNYNKAKELERKEYLERLLARTPAEIAEEESLLIEAKKYEIAAKKTIAERAQLLQLLDSPVSSSASIEQYLTSQGLTQLYNTLMTTKSKRKQTDNVPENPLTALNERLKLTPQQVQSQQSQQQAATQAASSVPHAHAQRKVNPLSTLLSKNLTKKEEQQYGIQIHTEKLPQGVYLRSSKIPQFKTSIQAKINTSLAELGVGVKPTMPTAIVMSRYEELVKNLGLVLELKRQVDKLESGR